MPVLQASIPRAELVQDRKEKKSPHQSLDMLPLLIYDYTSGEPVLNDNLSTQYFHCFHYFFPLTS